MIRRYHTVADFFPDAQDMRARIDAHFQNPYEQTIETHGIWNFWHVPGLYTFLRTHPERIFPRPLMDAFMTHIRSWAAETLGTSAVQVPQIHLYVEGCAQDLHSDYHNGSWGYVFSLTRWNDHRFTGGETLLFRDGQPNYKRHHVHGADLYDLVTQPFNQLLVFDDSLVHGVRTLRGTSIPMEGRIVLVGHITASDPIVAGGLAVEDAKAWIRAQMPRLGNELQKFRSVHGSLVSRLSVATDGTVTAVDIKAHQLASTVLNDETVQSVADTITTFLRQARFPAASSPSTITLPVLVPVPNLQPIQMRRPCDRPAAQLRARVDEVLESSAISGEWSGDACTLSLRVPDCTGVLRLAQGSVLLTVDVPMTRPSHRMALERRMETLLTAMLADH